MIPLRQWPFGAYLLPAFLVAMGALIFAYGSQFSEYNVPDWQARLFGQDWPANQTAPPAADKWFALQDKLRTPRDDCHDRGAAIILLGLAIAALFLTQRVGRFHDLVRLATPKTRFRFYLLAALTWLSFVPAEGYYYTYTGLRWDYPPFGDIIFIPIAGAAFLGMVGLPVVLVGVSEATRRKRLPCFIWSGPVWRHFGFLSCGIWVALVLAIGVLALGLYQQPPIVPSAVWTIYLLLSGKATAAEPVLLDYIPRAASR